MTLVETIRVRIAQNWTVVVFRDEAERLCALVDAVRIACVEGSPMDFPKNLGAVQRAYDALDTEEKE